jgi:hypothetical protein
MYINKIEHCFQNDKEVRMLFYKLLRCELHSIISNLEVESQLHADQLFVLHKALNCSRILGMNQTETLISSLYNEINSERRTSKNLEVITKKISNDFKSKLICLESNSLMANEE